LPDMFLAESLVADLQDNLFIADTDNRRIVKVTPQGVVTTVAGTPDSIRPGKGIGFAGDGGPAVQAELSFPLGLAVDSQGNVYLPDSENHRVRRIDRSGVIATVAGTGVVGFSGDGGAATAAQLYAPSGLAVDRDSNLWIADAGNHCIRKVAPDGTITTIA